MNDFVKSQGLITLQPGATAEPLSCGSCKFFKRASETYPGFVDVGWCQFRLPPMMKRYAEYVPPKDTDFDEWGPRRVKDTEGCDCHKPDGRSYIVQRVVMATRAGPI